MVKDNSVSLVSSTITRNEFSKMAASTAREIGYRRMNTLTKSSFMYFARTKPTNLPIVDAL